MAELVTPGSGTETVTTYVRGLDLSQRVQGAGGIGGLLLQDTGTKTRLYTYEANGNVGQLVDGTTGAVVAHYEYDPFGTTLTASGTAAAANPFRFSTKYTDDETNLLYYGYRQKNYFTFQTERGLINNLIRFFKVRRFKENTRYTCFLSR